MAGRRHAGWRIGSVPCHVPMDVNQIRIESFSISFSIYFALRM
jgi:hypothetical protein